MCVLLKGGGRHETVEADGDSGRWRQMEMAEVSVFVCGTLQAEALSWCKHVLDAAG